MNQEKKELIKPELTKIYINLNTELGGSCLTDAFGLS